MAKISSVEIFGRFYNSIVDRGVVAKASNAALRVYLVLLYHAAFESGRCWPSRNRLVQLAGIGKDGCHSALKELRSYGMIDFKRTSRRLGFRNAYRVIFPPKIPDILAFPVKKRRIRTVHTDKSTGKFVKSGYVEAGASPVSAAECVRPASADKEQDRTIEQLEAVDDPQLRTMLLNLKHTMDNQQHKDPRGTPANR